MILSRVDRDSQVLSYAGSLCLLFLFLSHSIHAQRPDYTPQGLAWQVVGSWQAEGSDSTIANGDSIRPGALLQPVGVAVNHSITVLLPDGQRILYECFTAEDCARGFRVPALYRTPVPLAFDLLARIHAVIAHEYRDHSSATGILEPSKLPRDEALATLGPGGRARVNGMAAELPNGRYTYNLKPLDQNLPRQNGLVLEKSSPSLEIPLPSPGLYLLTIVDDLNTPRINLFLAAVKPVQLVRVKKSYSDAKGLIEEWNGDYYGWPIHDFQRAYLASLVSPELQTTTRTSNSTERTIAGSGNGNVPVRSGESVAAEPIFSPKAGVFAKDASITLRCSTKGAVIHYTVDGSQPVANSPVYQAPIIVKGTELTIKSFASASGMKDSAVVTGIFRIRLSD